MNGGIIKDIIKLWFSLGVFLLQPTLEQRMLQREEMSEIIESSLPSLQKIMGQGYDCSVAGRWSPRQDEDQGPWSFFRQRFSQAALLPDDSE